MLKRKKIVIEVRNLVLGIKKKLKSLVSHIVTLSENSLCYEATGAAMWLVYSDGQESEWWQRDV